MEITDSTRRRFRNEYQNNVVVFSQKKKKNNYAISDLKFAAILFIQMKKLDFQEGRGKCKVQKARNRFVTLSNINFKKYLGL